MLQFLTMTTRPVISSMDEKGSYSLFLFLHESTEAANLASW